MAYTRVNWENYPSTDTPTNATNLNVMDAGLFNQDARITVNENEIDNLQTGWNSAGETWTYSSTDNPTGVITIIGDVTTKYSLGMRINFTNNSNVIYGIITKISYSSPNTTLTFLHEIDPTDSLALHLMANSAITNNYYSTMKTPYGFPINPDKWTLKKGINSNYIITSPSSSVYYGPAVLSIKVPEGLWEMSYQVGVQMSATSLQYCSANLSTSPTALENSTGLTDNQSLPVAGVIAKRFRANKIVELAEQKMYYFMFKNDTPYTDLYITGSPASASSMQAVCAYL